MFVTLNGHYEVVYVVESLGRYYLDGMRSVPMPDSGKNLPRKHRKAMLEYGFRYRKDPNEVDARDMVAALRAVYHPEPKIVTIIRLDDDCTLTSQYG